MVVRAGGYYGTEFQGFRGVTQEDHLYPTIFNVVVDAVVRQWVKYMVESACGQGGRRQEGRHQNALFYADYDMMGSSDPGWLQGAVNTLVGIFDRVGLRTNIGKTFVMVCRPCQATGTQLEAAYEQRMTGAVPSYWGIQRVRVQCLECGEEMALGSLEVHLQMQPGEATVGRQHWGATAPGGEPRTYNMVFPTARGPRNCPIEVCRVQAVTQTAMQVQFINGMSRTP